MEIVKTKEKKSNVISIEKGESQNIAGMTDQEIEEKIRIKQEQIKQSRISSDVDKLSEEIAKLQEALSQRNPD